MVFVYSISLYIVRPVQKSIFMTLSSQYKVKMKNNNPLVSVQVQFKIYDPLVSVQGQNEEQWPSRLSTRSKSRTTTLSSQYKVSSKINLYNPVVLVQGEFNSKFTTFSSQYKVKIKNNDHLISVQGQNQEQRPSRLSTRSVQSKFYDPLVSVQGQNQEQRPSCLSTRSKSRTTTLSSQYKVNSKINLYDPFVSIQSQNEEQRPSRLNTRLVQFKIYNPLISVQGQIKVRDPLVSVQGLDLYLCIYFIVFYFQNRMRLMFLSLLIFYSYNLNFKSSNNLVKFK